MIKCNFNKVEVHGTEPLILTELTVLMRSVKEYIEARHGKKRADNKICLCIKNVFTTEEELEEENKRMLNKAEDPKPMEDITEAIISAIKKYYGEE